MLLGSAVVAIVDPRRRPVAAAMALGLVLCGGVWVALSGQPAFAQSLPSATDAAIAGVLTVIAGALGGTLAARVSDRLQA
jgi:hypothetical protein